MSSELSYLFDCSTIDLLSLTCDVWDDKSPGGIFLCRKLMDFFVFFGSFLFVYWEYFLNEKLNFYFYLRKIKLIFYESFKV